MRSARRRRTIQISIGGDGVTVSAPKRASRTDIAALVARRATWILQRLREAPPRPALRFVEGETVPILGQELALVVEHGDGRRPRVSVSEGRFTVVLPHTVPATEVTEAARRAAIAWLRSLATAVIGESIARFAPAAGAAPSKWFVRDQKRRWGSCSADGSLRFNWRLAMLDPGLIDYVVVHELCHLRHPNHSREFWAAVAGILPRHAALRKRLGITMLPL